MSPSAAGRMPSAHVPPPDEERRLLGEVAALAAELRPLAPPGPAGERARAALDRLLGQPDARKLPALAPAFEEFARACADAAPEPEALVDDLCALVRERHAALLAEPAFARVIEGPRRRGHMLAWLLRENVGQLERTRRELHLRAAEAERLRAELARIDAERLTLADDLERSRSLAERGLAAAGLAHDFNNLLQTIVGHTSVALGELPDDLPERRALEQVLVAVKRAAELSRGLAHGHPAGRPEARAVDVNATVTDLLRLLAASSPARVAEQRVLAENLPKALVDPTDLRRIVMNLVMNAWQAIGTRRGTVRIATGVTDTRAGALVWVEVEDDGPGFTDEVRDRIFEPFWTTRDGGSGVGLPNVRLLVERWGGRIEAWSTPGAGARFRASLPAAPEPDESAGDDRPEGGA